MISRPPSPSPFVCPCVVFLLLFTLTHFGYAAQRELMNGSSNHALNSSITASESESNMQTGSPHHDNPHPEEHICEHIGMLNLILSSIEDVLWRYTQFEGRFDSDMLLETYFEALSFENKLRQSQRERSTARQNAEFFFIKGLATKASRPRGGEISVEYFHRALLEDSTFAEPRYQIALYHMRFTGDSTKIIHQIAKGVEYDPNNGELLRTLGMFYLSYNECDSARVYLTKAGEYLSEDDPRIPFYMGLTFDPY